MDKKKILNYSWMKYIFSFLFFSIFFSIPTYALQVTFTPSGPTAVDEGGVVTIDMTYLEEPSDYDFSVSPSVPCLFDVSFTFQGTALNPADYTVIDNLSVFIATGDSVPNPISGGSITFTITDDALFEFDETILQASANVSSTCITNTIQLPDITIIDDDVVDLDINFNSLQNNLLEGTGDNHVANIVFVEETGISDQLICLAEANITVTGGDAILGTDYNLITTQTLAFGNGDSNPKSVPVELDLLAGIAGDGDKTIELTTTFTNLDSAECKLITPPSSILTFTITDSVVIPPPSNDLAVNVISVQTDVQEGSGSINVANISFSLPAAVIPDSECSATANVAVTGGNAQLGTDFNLNTQSVSFGEGDANSKTEAIVLDLLEGVAGDGSKTVVLTTTLTSSESCPITTDMQQSFTVTISDDSFEAPTIALTADKTSAKEGESIIIKLTASEVLASSKIFGQRNTSARNIGSCDMSATWTYDGSTAIPADYIFNPPDIVNFQATPEIEIPLLIKRDSISDNDESFNIQVTLEGTGNNNCSTIPATSANLTTPITFTTSEDIAQRAEPEDLKSSICSAIRNRDTDPTTELTSDQTSFLTSNCEANSQEEADLINRNFEPEEVAAQSNAVLGSAKQQLRNVRSRLDRLRSNGAQRGVDVSGANVNIQGASFSLGYLSGGGGESEVNELLKSSRWGVFANGEYAFGKGDQNNNDTTFGTGDRNFDFNSKGLTIGADYRFPGEKMIAGAALGYKDFSADYSTQDGYTNTQGYNLSVYCTFLVSDKVYIDGLIGLGNNEIDSRRPVNNDGTGGDIKTFAIGKPDASELTLSIGSGYEFNKKEWTYTTYGRMDYTKGKIDAYREIASDDSARTSMFEIDKQEVDSLTSTLGIKANRVISSTRGVFIPQASIEWKHEFKNRESISGRSVFVNGDSSLNLLPDFQEDNRDEFDNNYFNIGVGVSAIFPKGHSGFLNIESRLGDSTQSDNSIKFGYRYEF